MSRLRNAPRAPLAVAAILATPLFFVALMATSLAVEKPSVHHVLKHGRSVTALGDPAGLTEVKIWLLAALPCAALVLVGTAAMLLGRAGVVPTSVAAIALSVALLLPLHDWTADHTARYPIGVDLIPPSANSDIYLRGEWEAAAKRTAEQLGVATIAIAALAIAIFALLEARRRRHAVLPPVPPPPPALATGGVPPQV